MSSTIVLSAGGTGGHLFPAQALAAELVRRGRSIVLMTDARGRGFGDAFPGARIETVPSASPSNSNLAGKLLAPLEILAGVMVGFFKLRRLKPRAVVGFGGYPSLPVMLAASLTGTPTLIHEQNAVLGRVNRLLANRVRAIAASLPLAQFAPKDLRRVRYIGGVVRPEVLKLQDDGYVPPTQGEPIRLLVFGGSQGARSLSELLPAAIAALPEGVRARLDVVQQARPEDVEGLCAAYRNANIRAEVAPFFADLPQRMANAHLVICRSGASTVSELAVIGRPAILVPYPFATDDHQAANAAVLENAGAAWAIQQRDLTAEKLSGLLSRLFANPTELAAHAKAASSLGQPDAAERLADLVEEIGGAA